MNQWEAIVARITLADSPGEAMGELTDAELRALVTYLRGRGAEKGLKALLLGMAEHEACERFLKEE